MKIKLIRTALSIAIAVVSSLLIVNFVFELIPTSIQGMPLFLPLVFCPIGIILAYADFKLEKNKWSKLGFILNSILLFVPIIWMVGGAVLFGV
ncbi:hypothetical protein [Bacillus sp. Brlt_9]|uniref:hypothetical protein n=1 Tax=Bacillus sp. Brlt_9 TaxID=3110916 RepID=UPI003F7CA16E